MVLVTMKWRAHLMVAVSRKWLKSVKSKLFWDLLLLSSLLCPVHLGQDTAISQH